MDNVLLAPGGPVVHGRGMRLRVSSVLVAIALVFATLLVVQHRAEAAPSAAVAAVALPSAGPADAQINFGQIICAALLTVRSTFAGSPFFSFVVAAINPILVAFGCTTS